MVAGSLLAVNIIVMEANIYSNIAKSITKLKLGLVVITSFIVFPISMLERVLISKKVIIG